MILKFVLGHHGVVIAAVPEGDEQFAVHCINGLLLETLTKAVRALSDEPVPEIFRFLCRESFLEAAVNSSEQLVAMQLHRPHSRGHLFAHAVILVIIGSHIVFVVGGVTIQCIGNLIDAVGKVGISDREHISVALVDISHQRTEEHLLYGTCVLRHLPDGGDHLVHRAILVIEDILFQRLFDVLACRPNNKRQHIGVGNGVFLMQCEEQMLTEVTLAEQLYADVLVLIVGQRDLFRRLHNANRL